MDMTEKPKAGKGSLIERAAQAYDFNDLFKAGPPAIPARAGTTAESNTGVALTPPETPASAGVTKTAVPSIATVAPTPVKPRTTSGKLLPVDRALLRQQGLIVPGAPPSGLSEEFRLVKRQLLLSALGGKGTTAVNRGQLILVCSAHPNEGKTFASVNLALSMASETDIEVILVDADVAKPEVLSTLALPAGPGLMDALDDASLDVEDLLIRTDVPNLSILPTGRQTNHDTELLASDRTAALIEGLVAGRPRRIVLFDSAPALAASPASTLALHVGQVLFVVRADSTSETDVRDAIELLDACPTIQLMLNSVTCHPSNRKFGSYYGFGE
jgi:exopolysaccharide/PEP-CTERM locus tyrosine autokinase